MTFKGNVLLKETPLDWKPLQWEIHCFCGSAELLLHILLARIELPPRKFLVRSISGLAVEYIVAIDVTRVRFPADAFV